MTQSVSARVAILYPADPAGYVPSGIDSYVKTTLKYAPDDLRYTLLGATSDLAARPLGQPQDLPTGTGGTFRFIPIVFSNPSSARSRIPLTVRYAAALQRYLGKDVLKEQDVLDFHRVEPVILFGNDPRPKILTAHMNVHNVRNKGTDMMWRFAPGLYEYMERRLVKRFSRVYAVQEATARAFADLDPARANHYVHLPPMLDSSIFFPAADAEAKLRIRERLFKESIPHDRQLVTFVGRLDHSKDPLLLMRSCAIAVERGANIHIIVVGDGTLRSEVESIARLGTLSGRVLFLGAKAPAEIADILRIARLFALTSQYEGLPIAMLEALATGVPAVATDVGDIGRVIRSGHNGVICKSRDPADFAAAIIMGLDLGQRELACAQICISTAERYRAENVLRKVYADHRLYT